MSTRKHPVPPPARPLHRVAPVGKRKVVKKRRLGCLWLMLSLLGAATLSATAGALVALSLNSTPLMQRQLSAEEAAVFAGDDRIASSRNLRLPELTRPVNILVLGVKVLSSDLDEPPPETKNLGYHALVNSFEGLSDTMLLLRFDPVHNRLIVLSIPRDTRTNIEGHGVTKINAANAFGGPALSAKAISQLLGGVGIDRYVRINVQGVGKLVEALGGVTVNVPKDMHYQDNSQHLYINLKAGKQHLDGDTALQFLRFRYDEYGDIGRVQRQQLLMRALVEQTLTPMTITRLPKILSVIQSHIDTNLSVEELLALVGFATEVDRAQVQMLMLPGDFSGPNDFGDNLSYWIPSYQRIDELVATYFDQGYDSLPPPTPAMLRVALRDDTGEADTTLHFLVEALRQAGYSNVYNADKVTVRQEPAAVTRIVAQRGDFQSATTLQQILGFGEVRVESTGDLGSDITIQLGKDWFEQQERVADRVQANGFQSQDSADPIADPYSTWDSQGATRPELESAPESGPYTPSDNYSRTPTYPLPDPQVY
ncbi:LCP family protein [Trichothermofontia sp.]